MLCESDLLRDALLILAHLPPNQQPAPSATLAASIAGLTCNSTRSTHAVCGILADAKILYRKCGVGTALVRTRESVTLREVAEAILEPLPLRLRFSEAEERIDAALQRAQEAYLAELAKVTLADVCGVPFSHHAGQQQDAA